MDAAGNSTFTPKNPASGPKAALSYQEQDSPQTLAEGVAEYRARYVELIDARGVSPELGDFLDAHDRCHVVFGLDTSLPQEVMADIWTMFGSDVVLSNYVSYLKHPEVNGILKEIGYKVWISQTVKAVPAMFRVFRRTRRMHKKWPFRGYEAFADRPLAEIRREFGIEVTLPS